MTLHIDGLFEQWEKEKQKEIDAFEYFWHGAKNFAEWLEENGFTIQRDER